LSNYLPLIKGKILDDDNNVLGEHNGLYFYTIGQRQGLGIGGVKGSSELPWYVAKKNLEENTLIVVQDNEHPLLFESKLEVSDINWLINQKPELNELTAKIRYRQKDQDCSLSKTKKNWQVNFKVPQRAITSGQSIVFYKDNICLGGGEII
jgi:tRNA-specific 2-thiouridylase